jgi:sulfonate transport system ATP-binding protein
MMSVPRRGSGTDGAARIRGLRKAYGTHLVFDGLDLDVARGERVAILGASGCGKSTLLRCIAGLERSDAGTIATTGEIGVVFQEPRLFPWLDVERNVALPARTDAERTRVPNVLALVGLAHAAELLPKQLSGGMAQRAALARALVRDPALLLLDEPFAALDALRRIELRAAVSEILEFTRASAILVTHDVDDALALADRVLVLAGAPAEIAFAGLVGETATRAAILDALGVAEVRSSRGPVVPRSARHGASGTS